MFHFVELVEVWAIYSSTRLNHSPVKAPARVFVQYLGSVQPGQALRTCHEDNYPEFPTRSCNPPFHP